jgi:hypothetical protein
VVVFILLPMDTFGNIIVVHSVLALANLADVVAFGYFWLRITFIALAFAILSYAVAVLTVLTLVTLGNFVSVHTVLALATHADEVAIGSLTLDDTVVVLALCTLGNSGTLLLLYLPWPPWAN